MLTNLKGYIAYQVNNGIHIERSSRILCHHILSGRDYECAIIGYELNNYYLRLVSKLALIDFTL